MISENRKIMSTVKKHHSVMDLRSKNIAIEVLNKEKKQCIDMINLFSINLAEYSDEFKNDLAEINECLSLIQ